MKGKHPVTQSDACALAGMQCQIELGNFTELQHKPGSLECVALRCLATFSPAFLLAVLLLLFFGD